MYSTKYPVKPCKPAERPPLKSVRLLDQVRELIRYKHYSIRTEESYVYWVRWFIRFHQLKHPRDMGSAEVTAFLSWLAAERGVAPSTHKQALSALLFLGEGMRGQTTVLQRSVRSTRWLNCLKEASNQVTSVCKRLNFRPSTNSCSPLRPEPRTPCTRSRR